MNVIPRSDAGAHWYSRDGEPCHFIEKKDGSGQRPTTLADARKNGWLPSVTTILKTLHKPELENWKISQACLAVATSPRLPDEGLDDFIKRVLHTERQQDQEALKARERGTEIHDALETLFNGGGVSEEIHPWVYPAFSAIALRGETIATEKILVGDGYAGKTDLIQQTDPLFHTLYDFKTTKKIPKEPWLEHRLQLGAYARAHTRGTSGLSVKVANVYISTVECGQFSICEHDNLYDAYHKGFAPLLTLWQFANDYKP